MTTDIDWDHPTDPREGTWQLDHVKLYVGSGGSEGQYWNGTQTLLLTTLGRVSGKPVRTPLIYGEAEGAYLVVASKGATPRTRCGTGTSPSTPRSASRSARRPCRARPVPPPPRNAPRTGR